MKSRVNEDIYLLSSGRGGSSFFGDSGYRAVLLITTSSTTSNMAPEETQFHVGILMRRQFCSDARPSLRGI